MLSRCRGWRWSASGGLAVLAGLPSAISSSTADSAANHSVMGPMRDKISVTRLDAQPRLSAHGQPIGPLIGDWVPPVASPCAVMEGRWCRVEPIEPARHAAELYEALREDLDGRVWTYFSYGPFDSPEQYRSWMEGFCTGSDPLFFAIRPKQGPSGERVRAAVGGCNIP